MIDTSVPYSDGWWLARLYNKLLAQQMLCEVRHERFTGHAPMPELTGNEREAVRLFEKLAGRNYERLIVNAVLSRLRIVGIRTAADSDEGGDADAFKTWRNLRGKLWTLEIHRMALSMGLAYAIVGKDDDGNVQVTAEDPRLVTAIADPANPYKLLAALKLFHDDVADQDVAYLYLPGRVMVATRPRKAVAGAGVTFNPRYYSWDVDVYDDETDELLTAGLSPGALDGLAHLDDNGNVTGGLLPVVEFSNEDCQAQFDPFLDHIDGIRKQVLDRMTIVTLQAFRQRAFKGLPQEDEKGNPIDYEGKFLAAPGAVWDLPESADIWESGQADISGVLAGVRDDVKDLYAMSGTPGYLASPDAANASAESASLQREMNIFNVRVRQDRFEPSHERIAELIFAYLGDAERSQLGAIEIIWAPAEQYSMSERANAIAQTKGVVPRYQQLTEIWGMDPAQADRAMSELTDDFILDQQYGLAKAEASSVVPASS